MEASDRLADRVAIVTGAGRGLGRAYAIQLAVEGASVVVNDLGRSLHGVDEGRSPADEVVETIRQAGGRAVANTDDVSDWAGAHRLVSTAVEEFGGLDVLVNNAGILRDRMLVNMTEQEWDSVVAVHLRGHFCTTRAAAGFWRDRAKRPDAVRTDAVLIHTTSISGLFGSVGQANYAAAKSGIATFAYECHLELNERLGVRSYAIAPSARTRLTENSPASADAVAAPADGAFDFFDPANVSPFVTWLAAAGCPMPSGQVFTVEGDEVCLVQPWTRSSRISAGGRRWTLDGLDEAAAGLAGAVAQ